MHNLRNPLGPPVRNRPADDKRPTVSSTLGMATVNSTNAWKPPRAYDNPYAHQLYRPPPIDTKGSGWRNPSSARPTEAGIIPSFRQALRSFLPAQDSLPLSAIQSTQRRNLRPSMPSIPTQIPDNVLPDVATVRFVLLCALWYSSSALSSNTGKSLMMQFKYPITLTFVQFGFVAAYCLLFMSPIVRFSRLRRPTRAILKDTLPMGLFQVGGHIFSSMAISRISVSTVHTIKALSPLFTVAAYALLFGVRYSSQTYISLLPLTLGVMLACSFEVSASNLTGLLCAFGSALVFVTSNIFFKKIMPTSTGSSASGGSHAHKLDKLNLLFYSSSMAFLLMIPIWLTTDLPAFLALSANPSHIAHPSHAHEATHGVKTYFFANGTVHFAQNIIAFIILASVSPVTYSIASLVKRVAVICLAIVWFSQRVYPIQALGIALTFFGLYLYHGAKSDVERGEKARRGVEAIRDGALPLTREEEKEFALARSQPSPVPSPAELQMNFAPDVIGLGIPAHEAYSTQAQMISPVVAKDAFHRGAPGLHIDTLPRRGGAQDPYPSPPASIDSPPLTAQLVPPVRS